jgi:peptidyl-prolyl cis-trans isomerase C
MNLDSPQTRYAMLRTALELFQRPPTDLDEEQSRELQQQVNSQLAIGKRLLEREEAQQVVVPEATVDQAFNALRAEYENDEVFDETLAYNGLNRDSLREALRYELKVEAALEQLMSEEAKVSDEEVEIYYLQHRERFTLPETRTVSHILITINDDYAENSREQALKRINELRSECDGEGSKLKQLAERHSECPSAMKEGVIGRVKQGQLYTELDKAAFALEEGEISDVLESEVGLHIIHCEAIHPAETLPLEQVKSKLFSLLEKKKRASVLKQRLLNQ